MSIVLQNSRTPCSCRVGTSRILCGEHETRMRSRLMQTRQYRRSCPREPGEQPNQHQEYGGQQPGQPRACRKDGIRRRFLRPRACPPQLINELEPLAPERQCGPAGDTHK
jgi:hypothetical protein